MAIEHAHAAAAHPEVAAHVQRLIEDGSFQRMPDLFSTAHADALYQVRDRGGVSVVVVPTRGLGHDQLVQILKYRLAQYLAVGYLNVQAIYDQGIEHEPLSAIGPNDIHILAGDARTGELVCYATLRALPDAAPGTTLRTTERPLLPVEQAFGWGVFNRLRLLPDLPLAHIRELGRLVKNQRLDKLDERAIRAPVEVCLAMIRTVLGPLRSEIQAVVGELEEAVAKRNLDYFNVPSVLVHGGLPYAPADSYALPHYEFGTPFPFALLVSDLPTARERCDRVEAALGQPGSLGLLALMALRSDMRSATSTLIPDGGLAPLTEAPVAREGVAMSTRREILDVGERLRTTSLFGSLSVAEAASLGTFMERIQAEPGDVIIRQGDIGEDLYVIETGTADVQVRDHAGRHFTIASRGPGMTLGEIALVTGSERTADVVATVPMTLLKLSGDSYARFLGHMVEVERQLARTAAKRATETAQRLAAGPG